MVYYSPHKWGFNMENINENYCENDKLFHIDKELLTKLRIEKKYQKVFDIFKDAYQNYTSSGFVAMQLMISTIDLDPFNSNFIKKIADILIADSHTKSGYFGYIMYYLSKNDLDNANKYFKEIKSSDFFVDLVITKMMLYPLREDFKPLIFDLDIYLRKLEKKDISNSKYNFYTFEVAKYYDKIKDFKKASIYYEKAIEKRTEKQCQYCYSQLAYCHHQLGEYDAARTCYKKAVEISKKYKTKGYLKCVHEYAFSLIIYGDYDEALKQADILDKMGLEKDKNMATSIRGKVSYRLGNYEEAIKFFECLLDKSPIDRKNALIDLVKTYRTLSNFDLANKYLDILYKENPSMDPIIKASFLYDFKLNQECINYCKNFIGTKCEDDAKYFMGKSYNRLGQYSTARNLLESIKNRSGKIAIYFELGFIYEKLGDFDKSYDSFKTLIDLSKDRNDKTILAKGLSYIISLLSNRFMFDSALTYLEKFSYYFPNDFENINKLYGVYYYRKQDYENAKICFKNLYGTKYENEAKNYLVVIYRYNGESKESLELISELRDSEYENHAVLNKAKLLKDHHTQESLIESYMSLYNIKDTEAKNMVIVELLQILIRFKKYKKAEEMLDEAFNCYAITEAEYYKFRAYILIKCGLNDVLDDEDRTPFINTCEKYDINKTIANNIYLNNTNQGFRSVYFSDNELKDLYYELTNDLDNYDYYMSGLYDIYVIDMGKKIGIYYGLETNYISVRCEQGTHNIHLIEPTLKRINATKYNSNKRIRTDLDKN